MRPMFQWTLLGLVVLMGIAFAIRGGSLAVPVWKALLVTVLGAAGMSVLGLLAGLIRPWVSLRPEGIHYQYPGGGGFLVRYEHIQYAALYADLVAELDVTMLILATEEGKFIHIAIDANDDLAPIKRALNEHELLARDDAG